MEMMVQQVWSGWIAVVVKLSAAQRVLNRRTACELLWFSRGEKRCDGDRSAGIESCSWRTLLIWPPSSGCWCIQLRELQPEDVLFWSVVLLCCAAAVVQHRLRRELARSLAIQNIWKHCLHAGRASLGWEPHYCSKVLPWWQFLLIVLLQKWLWGHSNDSLRLLFCYLLSSSSSEHTERNFGIFITLLCDPPVYLLDD